MTMHETTHTLAPEEVHEHLREHMLVDGYRLVLDLRRSQGAFLYDSLGERQLLDFFTSFSSIPLGYNHPAMLAPEFREKLIWAAVNKPANSDIYTTEMAEFVDTFSRTVPDSLAHHLFFISGGALAVENALKAAFDWKRQKNTSAGRAAKGASVLHFREAFHGRSGYTLSLTNTDPAKTRYFPKFDWPRISNPKLSFPITDEVIERVVGEEQLALAEIERALEEREHDIAALILEPIQGEGGDNHFRPEFLAALRKIADDHELLLIFDEVQTGFGTTGRWWCFEHFDVEPDLFAFGKKTQVCGLAATSRIDDVDSVFEVSSRINSTWGGNLVDMIRCQMIVEVIEKEDLLSNAERSGAVLLDGLRALEQTFAGKVTNARGRGLFLAFDLPDQQTRNEALRSMDRYDLLGLASGTRSIRFRPPLILSESEARLGLERAEQALSAVL